MNLNFPRLSFVAIFETYSRKQNIDNISLLEEVPK